MSAAASARPATVPGTLTYHRSGPLLSGLMWQLIRASLGGVLGVAILAVSGRAEITATVSSDRVNVRGGPSLASEVVCQVGRGATVVVLESVTVPQPKPGEPANWYKIQLPGDTTVWVNASFIHPTRKSVRARRLNVRAGPGENFSVLGRLGQGDLVREVRVMDDWMEIEPPAGTYAYVATNYVTLNGPLTGASETRAAAVPAEASTPVTPAVASPQPMPSARSLPNAKPMAVAPATGAPAPTVATPPPVPTVNPQPDAAATKAAPPVAPPPVASPAVEPATPPATTAAPPTVPEAKPAPSEPAAPPEPAAKSEPAPAKPKRIIQREGVVADSVSIQAPTSYKLKSAENGQDLNFLHPGPLGVRLAPYKGQRIVVTGEEQIDPRWPNLPMIEITRIQLAP